MSSFPSLPDYETALKQFTLSVPEHYNFGFDLIDRRADDLISSAGYRISPFEVEIALTEHPAVAESAAVGKKDAMWGEIVMAFVVLASGHEPNEALKKELQDFVKSVTAPYEYPREVAFVTELPKTVSGKIRSVELRELANAGS